MQTLSYYLIVGVLKALSFLSLKALHTLAQFISPILYHLIAKYRKRALSNLSLAKELNLDRNQVEQLAKKSLYHLLITAFEYGKLKRLKTLTSYTHCLNPEETDRLLNDHQGVIFFCGHQSNWELLFLDATSRHLGICIGKPIKNKKLYNYIVSIRERFKGRVIEPKNAYKGCMKGLKQGSFIGIVADQGMPDSSFSYACLGRQAHMSTLPALVSLRSGCPLYVATIERFIDHYNITYTGPVKGDDVDSLTLASLLILDEKIKKNPEQYMWQHNRWKITYPDIIPKKYRHDALAVVIDHRVTYSDLETLKQLYQGAYMIVFKPLDYPLNLKVDEIINYTKTTECFIPHYGPKLMIDLVGISGLEKHFKKQALFAYIAPSGLKTLIQTWESLHAH